MPGKMTPAQEKRWDESKAIVRKEKDKSQKKFKDRDWGLVQHIFKLKEKKHAKRKKKKAFVVVELLKIAEELDKKGLFVYADSVENIILDLVSVDNFGDTDVE